MAKGGWRYGAGRKGWKRKAETALALDVRQIARKGLLKPGMSFSWSWTTNQGEKAGNISVRVAGDPERVILSYTWTPDGCDPQSVECSLWIDRTACNYGSIRPWFLCPQCGRRCAVVYFSSRGGRFVCRHCAYVAYLSQSEDEIGRLWRKQRKIEARLIDNWHKPKGMHWKTYERLLDGIIECEEQKDVAFMAGMKRFGFVL